MKTMWNKILWPCAILTLVGMLGCQPQTHTPSKHTGSEPRESVEPESSVTESAPEQVEVKVEEKTVEETVMLDLDADGNGLYDPVERKKLLDVFLEETPEFQHILNRAALPVAKAANEDFLDFEDYSSGDAEKSRADEKLPRQVFDLDGDGEVTIAEQAHDRPPLPMLVPRRILNSDKKIPWSIDVFPEWISTAYLQEDVQVGEVAQHIPRGVVVLNAVQASPSTRPSKPEEGAGVAFAADSGQFLAMSGRRDARWDYRWTLLTFRIDGSSGSADTTVLVDLNRGNDSNKSSPKIWYDRNEGLKVQYVGANTGGLDKRVMTADNVVADGETWNVLVCGVRYGQMYASVNGVPLSTETPQPPRFAGGWPRDTVSYIGDEQNTGNMAWAYDTLVFGQTEPSEAMVRKLTGWAAHRLGFADTLPEEDPYRAVRPVLDEEDFPERYVHNDPKWNAWGRAIKDKSMTRSNQGGPRVEAESMGFERVFYDDFRANRLGASTSGAGDLWVGPGFNIAVGGKSKLMTPGDKPEVYPHDAENQIQTVSVARKGDGNQWVASALYSINDSGQGYTWSGAKVFRIRCRFGKLDPKKMPQGLFPAFWSYAPANLWWRTSNRTEVDWFEFDGKNGNWYNGLSSHYHYAYLKGESNVFAKNPDSYQRYKVHSGELTTEKSKLPASIFFWDGEFRTWEFVVDEDMTYVNVTVPDGNGGEKWVEVVRSPTPDLYLQELDLQFNYALKNFTDMPTDVDRLDYDVDFLEVLQKTEDIEHLPEVYTARPELSGDNVAGATVTCDPKVEGISDIRYFWYADGYPLTYGPDNIYTLTEADAGKEIRCRVKAVGALNRPEAWSTVLR